MTKQTAANNEFLKKTKETYNEPIFKRLSKLVNDGKQELAEYLLATGLYGYVGAEDVAQRLMDAGEKHKKATTRKEVEALFEKSRNL